MPTSKTCCTCKKELPVEQYGKDAQQLDGRSRRCRVCTSEKGRKYYRQNKEHVLEQVAGYREKKRSEIRAKATNYNKKNAESIAAKMRKHRADHPELIKTQRAERYHANPTKYREASKASRQRHLATRQQRDRDYAKTETAQQNRLRRYRELPDTVKQLMREYQQQWRRANKEKRHEYAARRRARLVGTEVERVYRKVVYDRDQGICYLCDKWVPFAEMHMDHVLALVHGGTHTYDNVATTHAICNLRKSAKLLSGVK